MTDFIDIEIVYLGECLLAGNKPGARWILKSTLDKIEPGEGDPVELARRVSSPFGKKTATGRVIGGVYQTQGTLEGEIVTQARFGLLKFAGQTDHFVISAFEAQSILAKASVQKAKAERFAKDNPTILGELEATAEKLKGLPYRERVRAVDAIRSALFDLVMKGTR
jgi:hypothetical protein